MKIGHRGAAGYAPENTIKGLRTALDYGVDAIEFDVRLTKDRQLVLCHDATLERIAGLDAHISDLTLHDIRKVTTLHGEPIPTLTEALDAVTQTPLIIELKEDGVAEVLQKTLRGRDVSKLSLTSFKHDEIEACKKLMPDIPVYLSAHTDPFSLIQRAVSLKATGIGLNYWILNPYTYLMARRRGLIIFVYTVNNPFIAKFIQRLYPAVRICTNFPDRIFVAKTRPRNGKAKGSTSTKRSQSQR